MHLNILCVSSNVDLWESHKTFLNAVRNGDSGLDIPCPSKIVVPGGAMGFPIQLGIKVETHSPFWLVSRSSISKTPLRMSNALGLIDRTYRGEIIARVDNFTDKEYIIERGTMLFQIVSFDGNTPTFTIVVDVGKTNRGEGGFGSTTEDDKVISAEQFPCSSKESTQLSYSS